MSEIKTIVNQSEYNISYIKLEKRSDCGSVIKGETKETNIWFPWVDKLDEFTSRTIIVEIIGIQRIFIWESGNHFYYSISKSNLDGPYNPKSEIRMDGNEFFSGKIFSGNPSKGKKALVIRNYESEIEFGLEDY